MIFHIKLKSQHDILKRKLILSFLKETVQNHEIEEDIYLKENKWKSSDALQRLLNWDLYFNEVCTLVQRNTTCFFVVAYIWFPLKMPTKDENTSILHHKVLTCYGKKPIFFNHIHCS